MSIGFLLNPKYRVSFLNLQLETEDKREAKKTYLDCLHVAELMRKDNPDRLFPEPRIMFTAHTAGFSKLPGDETLKALDSFQEKIDAANKAIQND